MIRVTNNSMAHTALNAVNSARARMQAAQQVALTGKRVALPSDDPAAAARARTLRSLQAAVTSHRQTIGFGINRLQTAEQALGEVETQLTRAKEIAYAMANDTYSAEQRQAAAAEVAQIRRTVIDRVNSKHLGEYVFAHVNTANEPYDASTSSFTYNVDTYSDVRMAEVGPSTRAEIGASGSLAFAARAADPTSVNVLDVLAGLETSLQLGDSDAVRANIDPLESAFDQVLAERVNVGVRVQRLRDSERAAEQANSVYTTLHADLVDADAAEAFSNLTLAETSMRAAVTVSARIFGPSLLDTL